MHHEALQYVNRFGTGEPIDLVEFGSRDVNGTPRSLFPNARWHGIDISAGAGVDEVADATSWRPETPVDVVVCCEVFEHTPAWREIAANAAACLKPGGRLIVTAAGPTRAPHSAVDGRLLRDSEHHDGDGDGEFYANIDPVELAAVLEAAGFSAVEVDEAGPDVRATGVNGGAAKPKPKAKAAKPKPES